MPLQLCSTATFLKQLIHRDGSLLESYRRAKVANYFPKMKEYPKQWSSYLCQQSLKGVFLYQ